jgi:hypothetical protein
MWNEDTAFKAIAWKTGLEVAFKFVLVEGELN